MSCQSAPPMSHISLPLPVKAGLILMCWCGLRQGFRTKSVLHYFHFPCLRLCVLESRILIELKSGQRGNIWIDSTSEAPDLNIEHLQINDDDDDDGHDDDYNPDLKTEHTKHSGLNGGSGWGWQGNDCQSSGLMLVEPANELY